ncbi:MAG TPA: DUF3592 domain-containing protein [Anaerolineales bacterium]|nr:DUF3592 domain-containing protein [Anaerolineales bacterium]
MTTATKNTSWKNIILGYGLMAFYIACAFGWMINNNNAELKKYKKEGIETTATVVSKSRTREGSKKVLTNHVQVTYSVGSLATDDFTVVITEVTKFVTDDLWEKAEPGEPIAVVYLKADPERYTVLKGSISAIDSQWFFTFLPAIVPAIVGLILTVVSLKLPVEET